MHNVNSKYLGYYDTTMPLELGQDKRVQLVVEQGILTGLAENLHLGLFV